MSISTGIASKETKSPPSARAKGPLARPVTIRNGSVPLAMRVSGFRKQGPQGLGRLLQPALSKRDLLSFTARRAGFA